MREILHALRAAPHMRGCQSDTDALEVELQQLYAEAYGWHLTTEAIMADLASGEERQVQQAEAALRSRAIASARVYSQHRAVRCHARFVMSELWRRRLQRGQTHGCCPCHWHVHTAAHCTTALHDSPP